MGKKSYVALRANPRLGVVVEENATEGAQIGRDLRLPDGSVPNLAQLAAALGVSEGTAQAVVLDWQRIQGVPPNVRALAGASGDGIFAVTGPSAGAFRAIEGAAGSVIVTNGDGVAGNPTIEALNQNYRFLVDPAGNYLTDPDGNLLAAPGLDTSDFPALGTPSTETVLRGDGAWSGGIESDGGAGNFNWFIRSYARPPRLSMERAQGTKGAPSAVTTGLVIGTQVYSGWNGAEFTTGAQIRGVASENWTPSAKGANLDFQTVLAGANTAIVRCVMDGATFRPAVNIGYALGTTALNWNGVYSNAYHSGASKVVGARRTGWAAATGTATRTTFDTSTVTTAQLAERVKALLDDLIAHGLIGA